MGSWHAGLRASSVGRSFCSRSCHNGPNLCHCHHLWGTCLFCDARMSHIMVEATTCRSPAITIILATRDLKQVGLGLQIAIGRRTGAEMLSIPCPLIFFSRAREELCIFTVAISSLYFGRWCINFDGDNASMLSSLKFDYYNCIAYTMSKSGQKSQIGSNATLGC
jgi:hypothetical protein